MTKQELIYNLSTAIAIFEGYVTKEGKVRVETIAGRHNNPGNIRLWGKYPRTKGYVVFPSAEIGWKALYRQVERNIDRGLTLREFFGGKPGVYPGYAPAGDRNHPVKYAEFVSSHLRTYSPTIMGIDQVLTNLYSEDTDVHPAS